MYVSRQLLHRDPKINQSFLEAAHNFGNKGLHGCDVDYFETFDVESAVLATLLGKYLKNGKHRNIGLASTGRGTYEEVFR